MVMETTKTFRISEFQSGKFESKMNAFQKKAKKLGINFGYEMVSSDMDSHTVIRGRKVYYTTYNYRVWGDAPTINGYTFVAKIEPIAEGKNLIHSHFTDIDFSEYHTCSLICEHCNKSRNRNFYFIIRNDTDQTLKMVGRNCLATYIGTVDAEKIAEWYASFIGTSNDDYSADDHSKNPVSAYSINVVEFLANVVCVVEKRGYVSAKNENESRLATKYDAMNNFFAPKNVADVVTDAHVQTAKVIIAYVLANINEKDGEYQRNVKEILSMGVMNYRHAGYIASVLPLYNRMMGVEYEKKNPAVTSQFVGSVGEKISALSVTVKNVNKNTDGAWGTTYIYTFDNNGNTLVWFSSRDMDLSVGNEIVISSATVKAHNVWQGKNQTIITRAKIG